MPGNEKPPRRRPGDQSHPHEQRLPDAGSEVRSCRICGEKIPDPFPNQYDCLECENIEDEFGLSRPNTSQVEARGGDAGPDFGPRIDAEAVETQSDLQADIERAELPPIRIKPEDKSRILGRIDGAGNEEKFRVLHIEGDWKRYYDESKYDDPYETAVVGYLRIVGFYARLSVLHMEAFYQASALYDSDFWQGWDRLNALEAALEAQANSKPNWRMYGYSDTVAERLEQARSRLNLIERRMDR